MMNADALNAALDRQLCATAGGDLSTFDDVVRTLHWPLRLWLAARCPLEIDPHENAHVDHDAATPATAYRTVST